MPKKKKKQKNKKLPKQQQLFAANPPRNRLEEEAFRREYGLDGYYDPYVPAPPPLEIIMRILSPPRRLPENTFPIIYADEKDEKVDIEPIPSWVLREKRAHHES